MVLRVNVVKARSLLNTVSYLAGDHLERSGRLHHWWFGLSLPFETPFFALEGGGRTADMAAFGRGEPPAFLRNVEIRVVIALLGAPVNRTCQRAQLGSRDHLSSLPNNPATFS